MASKLLMGAAFGGITLALSASPSWTRDTDIDPLALSPICSSEAAGSGGATASSAAAPATPPRMLPGFGNDSMVVTTATPEAQRWFNYGLQLARAFAHEPAKAAFAESVRLDPDCAMCAWGQAWAAGPTINYPINAKQKAEALTLAMRAQALALKGPEKERLLAAALVRRYAEGDKAFAAAMQGLVDKYPDDDEIGVWTADAFMVAGDWDDKVAARPPVALLEAVLKRNPDHTGAIHFYIHATEWEGDQPKAVPYADRLKSLAPGASHLIHMPSHTFYWVGRYRDAATSNLDAIAVDEAWIKETGWSKPAWELPYFGHNTSFALAGALMAGEAGAGLKIADRFAAVPADGLKSPYAQSAAGAGWAAYGRFLDPDVALARPEIADPGQGFLRAMRHYGRGEALARKGDAAGVRAEARLIKPGGHKMLKVQMEIARWILLGRADMIEGRYAAAARWFRKAADRQEKVLGTHGDPPVWWYPVRRSLAAALLADGRPGPAGEQAKAVLKYWIDDPMALVVLSRSEAAQGRTAASAEAQTKAQAGWGGGAVSAVSLNAI